jgi:hypothetical protein
MRVAEHRPARRWLGWAAVGVLSVAAVAQGRAQDPTPPPQQQPAAPAQPDQMTFTSDSMTLFFTVAEPSATDFEAFMGKVKEAFNASDKPERKQQGASWKLLMRVEPAQNGNYTYMWILDPVVKGVSYDLFKLLAEALPPDEVKALYDKVGPAIKQISMSQVRIIGPSGM